MHNEERKKKICDIIAPYVSAYGDDERIADALIAAGLTFEPMTFRIVENKPYSYTAGELANWKEDQDRIAKLLHRAEVAEREAIILSKWLANKTRKDYPYQAWLDAARKQAEKELAEEGEDE